MHTTPLTRDVALSSQAPKQHAQSHFIPVKQSIVIFSDSPPQPGSIIETVYREDRPLLRRHGNGSLHVSLNARRCTDHNAMKDK